jgi:hypothetical protein
VIGNINASVTPATALTSNGTHKGILICDHLLAITPSSFDTYVQKAR